MFASQNRDILLLPVYREDSKERRGGSSPQAVMKYQMHQDTTCILNFHLEDERGS